MKFSMRLLTSINQWIQEIPNNALDAAHQSAIKIKAIEDQHFQGKMISSEGEGGVSVYEYYKSALDRELAKINFNLTQLRIGHFFELGTQQSKDNKQARLEPDPSADIREKLKFIESVVGKYRQQEEEKLIQLEKTVLKEPLSVDPSTQITLASPDENVSNTLNNLDTRLGKKVLSKRKYSEEYEQEVIQELRQLREKRKVTYRIIPLLLIVPVLVQIIAQNFVYSPILSYLEVDKVSISQVRIKEEVGERALEEYRKFKDVLEIQSFLKPEEFSEALLHKDKMRQSPYVAH